MGCFVSNDDGKTSAGLSLAKLREVLAGQGVPDTDDGFAGILNGIEALTESARDDALEEAAAAADTCGSVAQGWASVREVARIIRAKKTGAASRPGTEGRERTIEKLLAAVVQLSEVRAPDGLPCFCNEAYRVKVRPRRPGKPHQERCAALRVYFAPKRGEKA